MPANAAWCSGGEASPPALLDGTRPAWALSVPASDAGAARAGAGGRASAVTEVLQGVALGQEVGVHEIVTLFSARGPEVALLADVADEMRRAAVGDAVTYVRNRNINYTNVCTFKCRFCAFSKGRCPST